MIERKEELHRRNKRKVLCARFAKNETQAFDEQNTAPRNLD